jgi:MFS transporter, SP family, arabinose:H+ symporter
MDRPVSNLDSGRTPGGGSFRFLAGVCLVASIGGLLFGFDTAVISGTVDLAAAKFALNKLEVGWFVSSALLGCILGAAVAGTLCDRFGRKPVLIFSAACFLLCAVFSAVPTQFSMLVAARIVAGLGVGMASVAAPMFICEFSPPRIRGRLVMLYQLSIVLGILLAYLSNWLLLQFAHTHPAAFGGSGWLHWIVVTEVWRAMFGAGAIPAAAFLVLLLFVAESPRWLLKSGQEGPALKILDRIGGPAAAQRQLAEIRQSLAQEEGSLGELFRPGMRRALLVAVSLAIFGQLSGVNIVVYYGPAILKSAGLPLHGAFQWQVALGVVNLVFTLIAIPLVDSLGRRPLLIWGMTAVACLLATTAMLLLAKAPALWIVLLLCGYMACESLSICAVIWVIIGEIFPNRIRGRAASIATFALWGANAAAAFLFPWFVDHCGLHCGFFVCSGVCLVAAVFSWRLVPETKGKKLEEIESYWFSLATAATPKHRALTPKDESRS